MSRRKVPRRKSSEKKLRFYRTAKEFCTTYSLPMPVIQFTKGSRGYVVSTQTIEINENEKVENFIHALGHHRYFLTYSIKDNILKRLSRVCLVSGASLIYFDWTNLLWVVLLLLSHSHYAVRQFYAEKHIPQQSQSLLRWLRLLIPISQI